MITARTNRRQSLVFAGAAVMFPWLTKAAHASSAALSEKWVSTVKDARGQTVYFHAWAGSDSINAYIQWVAAELLREYGVKLQHVKISDAAEVVKRIRTEKQAGRKSTEGTADLVWINGENFAAMKRDGLLSAPFAQDLPNFQWVDTAGQAHHLGRFFGAHRGPGVAVGHGPAHLFC